MRTEDIDRLYYNDDIKAKVTNPEVTEAAKIEALTTAVNYYRQRATELEGVPEEINAYLREHEAELSRQHWEHRPGDRLKGVIQHYRGVATNALLGCERFRDDLHAWLRGMVICLEMTGNAGTHAEKAARLRGAIELTEAVIGKIVSARFDFNSAYWRWKDTFSSDFPTREILEQKHRLARDVEDLKRQLAEAKGVPVEEIQTEPQW
jgi:hypothetical protein